MRENISIFAADNKDDSIMLYLTKRVRTGCG
jgi:hypothetical protein